MKKAFLPILLGTDANVYGMARSFHEEYSIKSVAVGRIRLLETKYSKIVDVLTYDSFNNDDVFVKVLNELASKYKEEYEKLILISCSDGYTELIVNNKQHLNDYIIPYIDKDLKEQLENKEDFYNICEQYKLDYPKTYICSFDNYKNIELPFDFPVAVKPSNSITYEKLNFVGKKKGYKANSKEELNKIVDTIYNLNYKDNMIIQDFIPGDDRSMYVMNAYVNQNHQVKMMCLGRCMLEDYGPESIGNYTAIISTFNEDLYKQVKDFLESINYTGFANFDFKLDSRDNKFKLFEINIRQGRSSYFCTAAKTNLVKYLVDDYIYSKDEDVFYNKNEHLWLNVPKRLLLKYLHEQPYRDKVKELIKQKKYSYTLKYNKDRSFKRYLLVNYNYISFYKTYRQYFNKREIE